LKPPYKATPSERKQIVEILIENGADVNAKLPDGTTAIHIATRAGIKDMVEILIAKGANINEKSGELESPLGVAIMQDQEEIADLLRKHGGKTADELGVEEYIYLAAEDGNIEAVKKHLATGADANAKNQRGQASLHYAAVEGYKEIAELLVVKGADVNAKDDDGKTPLDDANEVWEDASPEDKAAKKEIATLLRKHGGKSGAEDSIHTAAWIGNVVADQQHFVSGVDVNTKNKLGRTPMLYAIQRGHKEIAELLISKGAIQVPRIRINDAVRQSNIEAIKQHLAVGTNFDGRDYAGETPLYLAADFGDKDIVELLINGGANVNAISYKRISESKYTALDSALRSIGTLAGEPSSSHKAIVNLLRKHGGKTKKELEGEGK
jgi:ankyrin repeat protein